MYIEDLIHYIRDPINGIDNSKILPRDKSVIFSMSSQLLKNPPLPLTENQANLLTTILKNNKENYKDIPNFEFLINNPIYKYPFRLIELDKKICLIKHEDKTYIRVKLPYDKKINKKFNLYHGDYTFVDKQKYFYLTEKNIFGIIEALKDFDFEIDPKISFWYSEIKKIKDNVEEYKPIVDFTDNELVLRNTHKSVNEYFNLNKSDNVISNIFLAKSLGLSISKSLLEKIESITDNSMVKNILNLEDTLFSINNDDQIKDALEVIEQWPILVIFNDERNLHTDLIKWSSMFNLLDIDNRNMTVLFRSHHNKRFNEIIKENNLNNMLTDETKVVFVKGKIPKIIYKTEFKPKLIITSMMYFTHTSLQKLVEHHNLVLYYSDTGATNLVGRTFAKL